MRTYDPTRGVGQRPLQAVRPLPFIQALALYLWSVGWIVVVVGVFIWAIAR